MPTDKHYRAFISYSHRDTKWAKWLHRSLERYVVPIDAFPPEEQLEATDSKRNRKLTPVFRDRDEMPASGSLADSIREALESSENLIVLCSPNSVESQYVNAEIEIFRNLHPDNGQKIYALIIEGEPPECFPAALVADGAEPIAADAREKGDGKADSKLKLIAGMLGVGFDRLKQREAKRQRNRMLALVTVVSAVAVMTSASTIWALKAEQKAKKAQVKAEQSARESKAVLEFFETKVLAAARPKEQDGGLGIDTTIRKAIDKAESEISDAFSDQPLIEASIRHTIGKTYYYLGIYIVAVPQFERALELRKNELGGEHLSTLETMNNLSLLYLGADRSEEALAMSVEILKLRKKLLGPEHVDTLEAMNNLALSYSFTGRPKEALELREKTLQLLKKVQGPEHPSTLKTMSNLAKSYNQKGRLKEALELREKTLELRKKVLGSGHPDTLNTMSKLADSYRVAGRYEEALPLYEETLALRKKVLGLERSSTFKAMSDLANFYSLTDRLNEALDLRKNTLELRKKVQGPEHLGTLKTMNSLAYSYRVLGNYEKAWPLYKETLALRKKVMGVEDPITLRTMNDLAYSYKDADRYEEALPIYEETLTLRKKVLGIEHPDTLKTMTHLAYCYWKLGKLGAADKQYRKYLSMRKKESVKDWLFYDTQTSLGALLTIQNKYDEAEFLLLSGHQGLGNVETDPEWIIYSVQRLVKLYTDWGKPEKAKDWQVKLDALGKVNK